MRELEESFYYVSTTQESTSYIFTKDFEKAKNNNYKIFCDDFNDNQKKWITSQNFNLYRKDFL